MAMRGSMQGGKCERWRTLYAGKRAQSCELGMQDKWCCTCTLLRNFTCTSCVMVTGFSCNNGSGDEGYTRDDH